MPRIIALVLLAIAFVVGLTCLPSIISFLRTLGDIGSDDPKAQLKGLTAYGVIVISILAAMRIALNASRQDR